MTISWIVQLSYEIVMSLEMHVSDEDRLEIAAQNVRTSPRPNTRASARLLNAEARNEGGELFPDNEDEDEGAGNEETLEENADELEEDQDGRGEESVNPKSINRTM